MNARRALSSGFLDQGIVSLTTVVLLIAAAQNLDSRGLGAYALGVASVQPAIAISRTLTGESLLFRVASAANRMQDERIRKESGAALAVSLALGGVATLLAVTASLFWTEMGTIMLAVAVVAPGAIVQDGLRHVLMARRENTALLVGDVLLLGIAVLGTIVVGRVSSSGPALLLVWGVACWVAALAVALKASVTLRPRESWAWHKETRRSSSAFLFETIAGSLAGYLIIVVLNESIGTAEVGIYKTCMSVFGLTSVSINFLRTVFLREIDPVLVRSRSGIARICGSGGAVVFVSVALTYALVVIIPPDTGVSFFGTIWPSVVALAPLAALNRLAAGFAILPLVVLRVLGITWRATAIRLGLLVAILPVTLLLTVNHGPAGAIVGDGILYSSVALGLLLLALARVRS